MNEGVEEREREKNSRPARLCGGERQAQRLDNHSYYYNACMDYREQHSYLHYLLFYLVLKRQTSKAMPIHIC